MNAQTFKAMLRWVLLSLCILRSTPVVGQTTTSAPAAFPKELPIGVGYESKLRAEATSVALIGFVTFEVDGVREYLSLNAPGLSVTGESPISPTLSDEQVILTSLPYLNQMVEDGRIKLNARFAGTEQVHFAFAKLQIILRGPGNNTELYSAVWYRYYILSEELQFDAGNLTLDEVQLKPAIENDAKGQFSYGFSDNLKLSIKGVMVDAVDADGNPDTSSSYTQSEGFETDVTSFKVPAKYITGSCTGKLYLQISSTEAVMSGSRVTEQVLAIDLQTGQFERPTLQVLGTRLLKFGSTYQLRPNCLVPRGATFKTLSSMSLKGPWVKVKSVTAGPGGSVALVEFETGVNFTADAGYVKVVIDDDVYPTAVKAVLPKP